MSYTTDTFRTITIRMLVLILNVVGGVINARTLGPEGLGIFSLLTLVQSLSFRFGNLGIGIGLSFYTAKKRASSHELIHFSWLSSLILSLLCAVFIAIFWRNRFLPWHDITPGYFYISLTFIPIYFLRNFTSQLMMGNLKIKVINISEMVE
ncbi:MAG: oligosaccharide flippase family protein, partial [Deltaproteobacteria bacterium]|nr:oligosaccharide flippase family protein [Deltaproteobacteria bacterium]